MFQSFFFLACFDVVFAVSNRDCCFICLHLHRLVFFNFSCLLGHQMSFPGSLGPASQQGPMGPNGPQGMPHMIQGGPGQMGSASQSGPGQMGPGAPPG